MAAAFRNHVVVAHHDVVQVAVVGQALLALACAVALAGLEPLLLQLLDGASLFVAVAVRCWLDQLSSLFDRLLVVEITAFLILSLSFGRLLVVEAGATLQLALPFVGGLVALPIVEV